MIPGSSAVEHSTVNRQVAGSNPARGAKFGAVHVAARLYKNPGVLDVRGFFLSVGCGSASRVTFLDAISQLLHSGDARRGQGPSHPVEPGAVAIEYSSSILYPVHGCNAGPIFPAIAQSPLESVSGHG